METLSWFRIPADESSPLNAFDIGMNETAADPYWLIITDGFSETRELTLRIALTNPEGYDTWVTQALELLTSYAHNNNASLEAGDNFDGLVVPGTEFVAVLFDIDQGFPGSTKSDLEFLQVIPVTHGELEAAQHWNGLGLVAELRRHYPALITHTQRESILRDDETRSRIQSQTAASGSSMAVMAVDKLTWRTRGLLARSLEVSMSGAAWTAFTGLLRNRLLAGQQALIAGNETAARLLLEPAEESSWEIVNVEGKSPLLRLCRADIDAAIQQEVPDAPFQLPGLKSVTIVIG